VNWVPLLHYRLRHYRLSGTICKVYLCSSPLFVSTAVDLAVLIIDWWSQSLSATLWIKSLMMMTLP